MKLIIQIPCLNEEKTLPAVIRDLPKHIEGVDCIETQVIDDGSTDRTTEVAKELGVDYIVRHSCRRGLAAAFQSGVANALRHGADILVNTDGDNQYHGPDTALLVRKMIEDEADLVIGCRPIRQIQEFSFIKRWLQLMGSFVVRLVSNTEVPDATSGFRAYSRRALMQLNIVTTFSYCLETIIQAGLSNMKVEHMPIRVNSKTRPSRLFSNIFQYVFIQAKTIVRMLILYRSNLVFGLVSTGLFAIALLLLMRYLYLINFQDREASLFWPTVILSGVLLILSALTYLVGMLASLLSAQRKVSDEILFYLRVMNLNESPQDGLGYGPASTLRMATLLRGRSAKSPPPDDAGGNIGGR